MKFGLTERFASQSGIDFRTHSADALVVWLEHNDLDADAAAFEERWRKILPKLVEIGDLLLPPKIALLWKNMSCGRCKKAWNFGLKTLRKVGLSSQGS